MTCPRCNAPAEEQTLREFGGVCPKCLLEFSEEQDAPAFPNLEILSMLGQGGMGVVYKARQKNLDRIVALKVLSPQLSDDPEFVERFTREAKALAQLSHPNIVGIHDSGIHDRVPFLVMEYVDGTPLRKVLAGGKLTPARALEVIPQICDALQYAHTHGVVHRDIKPENILIDRQGRVKIADFGLAKLSKVDESRITQSGYVMGTPRYMAPEQFEASGRVDHRADIYSLGVVFYEMLTGEVPMGRFKPPSAKADVDRRLDPVVLKSLEREPKDRYQSAGEVKEDVRGLNSRPADGPRPPRTSRALKKAAGVITMMGAGALSAGLLLGALKVVPLAGILVTVGGALLLSAGVLWLLSFAFGSRDPGPRDPGLAQERLHIGGCLLFVLIAGMVLLGCIALFLLPRREPEAPVPPSAVAVPAPVQTRSVFHESKEVFTVDDIWPVEAEIPQGFTAIDLEGDVLKHAGLPLELRPDLEYTRFWKFQNGAFLVGLQFKTDLARLRWEKEPQWQAAIRTWHYRLAGPGKGVVLLRHDSTPLGEASKELLEAVVKNKWVEKCLQPRKK